ncbi:MAG TPA: hypothetical protein PKD00_00205 [Burkholderiales bacterium]|nr:hypothetical protein [Burkholderiales bacterium]
MILIIDTDTIIYSIAVLDLDLKSVIEIFDKKIKGLVDKFKADNYILVIEGNRNFRNKFDPNYKKHRSTNKPIHYKALRHHVQKQYKLNHHLSINVETDDVCSILANICLEKNIQCVIIHTDKDLNQIVGQHYNPKTKEEYYIDENNSKYLLCLQILMGDPTDSKITGISGIGKTKAFNILNNALDNNVEYMTAVFDEFIKKYSYDIGVERFYNSFNIIKLLTNYSKIDKKLIKFLDGLQST